MKTSAQRTSKTSSPASLRSTMPFVQRKKDALTSVSSKKETFVQPKLNVSQPGDAHEREADQTAVKILRMPETANGISSSTSRKDDIQRKENTPGSERPLAPESGPAIMRKETGGLQATDDVASGIKARTGGGQPLPEQELRFMESRFGADFSQVRIHNDPESARLNNHLSARAFTYQNHIFFNDGQFRPGSSDGRFLLAHELTHTLQQGHAVQRKPQVTFQASTPAIQRLGLQDILSYFADRASSLPGFTLLTLIIGYNPINRQPVERSASRILQAIIDLVPGGQAIASALANYGVFDRMASFAMQQLRALANLGATLSANVRQFIDSLHLGDIFDPAGVWNRAVNLFTSTIGSVRAFIGGLVTDILNLMRQIILRPLAALAEGTAGYNLLKALLGRDPVTGDPYPRTAETVIGGFLRLIGQEEIWNNIVRANAIPRAWAWFQGALSGLMAFVTSIPGLVISTIASLTWQDIVTIAGVFIKVGRAFAGIASRFVAWGGAQVYSLLELIFEVVAPAAIPYLRRAGGALRSIIRNPVGFITNLVNAGKMGFRMFASRIGMHLRTALIRWITGPLGEAGVYIPRSFSLPEIVRMVLSVLGLTWQNIRSKLLRIIPEPVLSGLERTAGILVTLVREGPIAAWEQIKNELSALKDQLISGITQLVTTSIVQAAVVRLVSMLNPAGAFIQAIIAIYNTIQFFVQRLSQIAAVAGSFINSIAAIASGQIVAAAARVEQTMAATLPLVIGFLARLIGIGNLPERIVGVVRRIRQPIDRGLDRIVTWLGSLLKRFVEGIKDTARRMFEWWKKRQPVSGGGESHTLTFDGSGKASQLVLRSAPEKPSAFMERAANERSISASARRSPIAKTVTHEARILTIQNRLRAVDDNNKAAASGKLAKKAEADSRLLDTELSGLATHIGTTLNTWGVKDGVVSDICIPRGSFTLTQKQGIASEHLRMNPGSKDLVPDSKGNLVNLRRSAGLARRHVVSSDDISKHYSATIKGKKYSQAKLLIEQRGSIAEAHTPVSSPLSEDAIKQAIQTRYSRFFGYMKNIFIGDSRENSSIQQHLDDGHPEMAGRLLNNHVARIKRSWAIDNTFTETPVK